MAEVVKREWLRERLGIGQFVFLFKTDQESLVENCAIVK